MARPIRVEFEGALYHVTARGNERREIFRGDADREMFLRTLAEAIERFGLILRGWCLMPNHYHLILETPLGNLSRAMGWLQTAYTIRFNHRHHRSGHLFQGRFKAHLVDTEAYGMELLRYVHLNPVRPRDKRRTIPADRRMDIEQYAWSSHRDYAGLRRMPPVPVNIGWLTFFGRGPDRARAAYRRFIRAAFTATIGNPWDDLRAGLVLGGDDLFQKVSATLKGHIGQDEIRWSGGRNADARARALASILQGERDERVRIWARVRLGLERPVDIAREKGYRDGGSILQILKRTETRALSDRDLGARLARLRRQVSRVES
ncbi:MAG TPA: transposase [Verrucomicrobiae bacterium]|nr:transposase [Verrucomicrobiae bacterium]